MSILSWGVETIGAPSFWPRSRGAGQIAAVLDTGIDDSHPLLQGRVIHGTADCADEIGHGTHVAGIIAAIAPDACLLNVKIDAVGGLIQAIRFAMDWRGPSGEKVSAMNISQSVEWPNVGLEMAIKDAVAAGILLVCAAGNEGGIRYPAGYPEVISVGAIDQAGQLADFSNSNAEVDYVAPGVDVWSCGLFGSSACMSGTSQAAPHVTGIALLVRAYVEAQLGRLVSVEELRGYLLQLRRDIGLPWSTLDLSLPLAVEPDWERIDIREAIQSIHYRTGGKIMDPPEFWLNLAEKYDRGEPFDREDFRYVALLMKKVYHYGVPR